MVVHLLFRSFLNTLFPLIKKRNLSIHEYKAIELLKCCNLDVPKGYVATTLDEVIDAANKIGKSDYVIKAQVLAGGRGKGEFSNGFKSGIHIVHSLEELKMVASKMLSANLITKQTSLNGLPCHKVYICQRIYVRREFYLALTLDRSARSPALIGSSSGGVNIEESAQKNKSAIITHHIDIDKGLIFDDAFKFCRSIGVNSEHLQKLSTDLINIYDFFLKNDLNLVEFNPLCENNEGKLLFMDCKMKFDDNALFRHEEICKLRDITQEDPREVQASKFNLNYISLDGNIGCLVNGAGLAMATMDIIKLHNGSPANFLDVGGGATSSQVTEAFRIISSDKKVKAIFVNIFGGIMRCDVIADGIINAAKNLKLNIPIVVRLQGTKVEEAKALMATSGLKIISLDNFESSASMVVKLADIVQLAEQASVNVNFELPI